LNIICKEVFTTTLVYNSTGLLAGTFGNETSIPLSGFASGLYFIRLVDKDNRLVAERPFIKN
jgi:hypothetical protein